MEERNNKIKVDKHSGICNNKTFFGLNESFKEMPFFVYEVKEKEKFIKKLLDSDVTKKAIVEEYSGSEGVGYINALSYKRGEIGELLANVFAIDKFEFRKLITQFGSYGQAQEYGSDGIFYSFKKKCMFSLEAKQAEVNNTNFNNKFTEGVKGLNKFRMKEYDDTQGNTKLQVVTNKLPLEISEEEEKELFKEVKCLLNDRQKTLSEMRHLIFIFTNNEKIEEDKIHNHIYRYHSEDGRNTICVAVFTEDIEEFIEKYKKILESKKRN